MFKSIITTLLLISFSYTSLFSRDININKIIQKASVNNKKVFVFLHRVGCSYCNSMIEFTLDDEKVKALLKKDFSFTHINVTENDTVTYEDFKGSGLEFAKYVGYNIYPSSLFFGYNRELEYAVVGYKEEDEFLVTLQYVDSGTYKKMDLRDYKKSIHFVKKSMD